MPTWSRFGAPVNHATRAQRPVLAHEIMPFESFCPKSDSLGSVQPGNDSKHIRRTIQRSQSHRFYIFCKYLGVIIRSKIRRAPRTRTAGESPTQARGFDRTHVYLSSVCDSNNSWLELERRGNNEALGPSLLVQLRTRMEMLRGSILNWRAVNWMFLSSCGLIRVRDILSRFLPLHWQRDATILSGPNIGVEHVQCVG